MADRLYVAKRDMQLGGSQVNQGEIVKPGGNANDHLIYGDNTYWTYRFDGETVECSSDGCGRRFATLGQRDRHARLVHGPERENRLRRAAEAQRNEALAEERGETIGGHEVVAYKDSPGGKVPYVSLG